MAERPRRLIKRYANRKLYDTVTSKFTTLQEIHSLLLDGEDVRVVDHATGTDRTAEVLNQILARVQAAERLTPAAARIADLIRAVPFGLLAGDGSDERRPDPDDLRPSA